MQFNLTQQGDVTVLTVFVNGQLLTATNQTHPNIGDMVMKAMNDDDSIVDDFTQEKVVEEKFRALSERVSVRGGNLYLDGDLMDGALAEQIIRFLEAGIDDWEPLVLFMEKLQQNPSEHSRKQLFRWLAHHKFTISAKGDIVAYKGVDSDMRSTNSGYGIVDGKEYQNSRLPNEIGSVIEMPRSMVDDDPDSACSTGLHIANWRYASGWSGSVKLEIHVNPRDVVSVPTDSNSEKVRACRYTVAGIVTEPYQGPLLEAEPIPVEDRNDWEPNYVSNSWDTYSSYWEDKESEDTVKDEYDDQDGQCWNCGDFNCEEVEGEQECIDRDESDDETDWDVYDGYADVDDDDVDESEIRWEGHPVARYVEQHVQDTDKIEKIDTRRNHLQQRRGPGGRFLKRDE